MKYLYLFILIILVSDAISQGLPYSIKGKVTGKYPVKHALFYDKNMKLIGKTPIKDQHFSFSGIYHDTGAVGELPLCFVYCTNLDKMERADISLAHVIYFEPNVNVLYDSGKLRYAVSGGPLNKFENTFIARNELYKKKIDSAESSINNENINVALKTQKRMITRLRLSSLKDSADLAAVLSHPGSVVSLAHFPSLLKTSRKEATQIFNAFSEKLRNSGAGKGIAEMIAKRGSGPQSVYSKPPKLSKNDKMYDFLLEDIKGQQVKSTSVFGKYTLIDFWATWCIPCRAETPNLRDVLNKYKASGFKIIAISVDQESDRAYWKAMVEFDKMQQFVNLSDAKKTITENLDIRQFPSNYLVDAKGKVVASNLMGQKLENKLQELFGK